MSAEQSAIELGVTFGAGGGISAEESAGEEEEEEEGVPLSSVEVQQHSLRFKDFFFFPIFSIHEFIVIFVLVMKFYSYTSIRKHVTFNARRPCGHAIHILVPGVFFAFCLA